MRRLVLFAHFDARGEVKRFILEHLRALRPFAERVVFASTAALGERALAALRPLVDDVLVQENRGFDFTMWRTALAANDLDAYDEVLLVNSSIFGPLAPLDDTWRRVAAVDADLVGLVESLAPSPHLQSWFLVLRRPVLRSPALRRFFDAVLPYEDKWATIMSYEVGFTPWLLQNGFRAGAVFPYRALIDELMPVGSDLVLAQRNPSIVLAVDLLKRGMPYAKVEAIRGRSPPHASPQQRLLLRASSARLRRWLDKRGVDYSETLT